MFAFSKKYLYFVIAFFTTINSENVNCKNQRIKTLLKKIQRPQKLSKKIKKQSQLYFHFFCNK